MCAKLDLLEIYGVASIISYSSSMTIVQAWDKWLCVERLPDILVLHIKRFSFSFVL
jgi:hypothetical protein